MNICFLVQKIKKIKLANFQKYKLLDLEISNINEFLRQSGGRVLSEFQQ